MERLSTAVLLVFLATVTPCGGTGSHKGRPAYYWSRERSGSLKLSQRTSHLGPLPQVNDFMTEWSGWNNWARCSRSCGGGVQSRRRTCTASYPRVMPGSGVRTTHSRCIGDSIQYQVCGGEPCPPGEVSALSFRAAQCRHYNNRKVFGKVVNNWVPHMQSGLNPCALVCEGEGEGLVYTFGKVSDGTHCRMDQGQDGLCVNGRCLRLSCDGRLGGITEEDMCRVCGGHNDTCTKHVGVFHTDLPAADQPAADSLTVPGAINPRSFGYYEVTLLPKGATNVKIKDSSPNFLALKSGSKFLLNGNWLIDWPGEVDAGGATFSYARAEDESEVLSSIGPTTEDLSLMVLLREHNPGIHYEYWTPNAPKDPLPPIIVPLTSTTEAPTGVPASTVTVSSAARGKPAIISASLFNATKSQQRKMQISSHHTNNITSSQKKHKSSKFTRQKKKRKKGKQNGKSTSCKKCIRAKRAKENFCSSDFVSRIEVISAEKIGDEWRHEVVIHQSYKNTVPLLHKEFLWVNNPCPCPRLRSGKMYVVMGKTAEGQGREIRLMLGNGSYVKRFSPRNLARIVRIRQNEMKFCHPWRRTLYPGYMNYTVFERNL